MSKTLYDEAVADAQKLRELAEETAKNKIIEAVMPQIRDLVNKRILGEDLEDLDDDMMSLDAPEISLPPMEDHLEEPEDEGEAPAGTVEWVRRGFVRGRNVRARNRPGGGRVSEKRQADGRRRGRSANVAGFGSGAGQS